MGSEPENQSIDLVKTIKLCLIDMLSRLQENDNPKELFLLSQDKKAQLLKMHWKEAYYDVLGFYISLSDDSHFIKNFTTEKFQKALKQSELNSKNIKQGFFFLLISNVCEKINIPKQTLAYGLKKLLS